MDIYRRIKLLRKSLNMTQTEFANKLGMTLRGVQKWEHGDGEIRESYIKLIESTFKVNPSWLREGVGEMFMFDEAKRKTIDEMGIMSLSDIPKSRISVYMDHYLNPDNILETGGKQEDLVIAVYRALSSEAKLDILKYMNDKYRLEQLTPPAPQKKRGNAQ